VDAVQGGWKPILYANLALIDPQTSYAFFADPNFNTPLDGGASRTFYIAYAAALRNANNVAVESDQGIASYNQTVDAPVEGGSQGALPVATSTLSAQPESTVPAAAPTSSTQPEPATPVPASTSSAQPSSNTAFESPDMSWAL